MILSSKITNSTFFKKMTLVLRSFSLFRNKHSKLLIFIFSILLIALICVRDLLVIELNKYLFIPVFLLAGIFLDLISFSYFFIFSSAFFIGLPSGLLLPICLFILVVKNFKKSFSSFSFLVFPVLITIAELFLNHFYANTHLNTLVQLFSTLAIVCYFVCFSHEELNLKKIIFFFCLGLIICYLIIAVRYIYLASWAVKNKIHAGTTYNLIFSRSRFGSIDFLVALIHSCDLYPKTTTMHLNDNANNVAFYCLIAIAILLNIELTKKERAISYLMIILFVVFGLWSQSRTFLILLAILFICYFVLLPVTKKQYGKLLFGSIFLVIALIAFFITIAFVPFVRELISRFFVSDGGGGRFEIFRLYSEKWIKTPLAFLFGFGLTSLNTATQLDMSPHTNILQVMCSYGVIGLSILSFDAFLVLKNKMVTKKNNFTDFAPLVLIIAFTLTIQSMYPFHLLYAFIPAFLSVSTKCKYDNYLYKIKEILLSKNVKPGLNKIDFYEVNI